MSPKAMKGSGYPRASSSPGTRTLPPLDPRPAVVAEDFSHPVKSALPSIQPATTFSPAPKSQPGSKLYHPTKQFQSIYGETFEDSADRYLAHFSIRHLIQGVTEQLYVQRPEDPVDFLITHLETLRKPERDTPTDETNHERA
eukprot:m.81470 g.81470  ORF g.81470 m.81470 type:complete len:142 (+) comp50736_c0_seq3:155-580(+)